jgi:FAD:protein FMN transferase
MPSAIHPRLIQHRVAFAAMAADNEIQLFAKDLESAERAAQLAIDEVKRIEAKYSRYQPDSIVSQINAAAGGAAVTVDDETAALIQFAASCFKQSDGLFDITSGVLRRAWDFRTEVIPKQAVIAKVLDRIGWGRVEWSPQRIRLPIQGMELDFGGFGKEYAADRAANACLEAGIQHGFVNLAGDIRIIGPQPDGSPWRIGIRHPRRDDATIATVTLSSGALATSGDYERFFEIDGKRYCHILNPKTGWPVRHWQSVSILAPACVAAGSYCTIAMLLEGRARKSLERDGVQYLAIDAKGRGSGPLAR